MPSATLSFIDTLAILPLSYVEHTRSVRPSTLLGVYLLMSLVFDIPQARTLYLRDASMSVTAIFTAAISAKVVLLVLEAQSKKSHLIYPFKEFPPEATSGIWNRTFFWWLNSLFVNGFRRLVSLEDLEKPDPGLSSEMLRDKMRLAWEKRGKLHILLLHNFIFNLR